MILVLFLLSACVAANSDTQKEPSNVIGNSSVESETQLEDASVATEKTQQSENEDSADNEAPKILIAYFSFYKNRVFAMKLYMADTRFLTVISAKQ